MLNTQHKTTAYQPTQAESSDSPRPQEPAENVSSESPHPVSVTHHEIERQTYLPEGHLPNQWNAVSAFPSLWGYGQQTEQLQQLPMQRRRYYDPE